MKDKNNMIISIDTEKHWKKLPPWTLMKEIDKATKKWKDILCPWIDIIKMSILPTAMYRFNAMSIEVPMGIFHRERRNNPKTHLEPKKSWNNPPTARRKNKIGRIILSDLKTHYTPGWVAQLVTLSWYTKFVGSVPGQGKYKNQQMNV